jgi:hypothetical protein
MTWSGFWDFLFPEGVTAFFIFAAIALSCCIVIRFIFWEEYKKFVIFPRSERFYLVLIAISMVFVVFLYLLVCQIEAA